MRYNDFYVLAEKWIRDASEENRQKYAISIIKDFQKNSKSEWTEDLTFEEIGLLEKTISAIQSGDIESAESLFDLFNNSVNTDNIIDFCMDLKYLLTIIEMWLSYKKTNSVEYLVWIAENRTDAIDDHWESETMLAEIEWQRTVLAGEVTSSLL
jgi:hypothetical protein